MAGFTTKAIHTPYLKKDVHGSLQMPVYDSVTFEFESAEEIEAAFMGQKPRHAYSRITNPTVEHLEQKIKNVSGALAVVAVSSGMAAIANTVMNIAQKGDNIITTKYVFGNTYSLFEKTLAPWGLETRYADFSKPETIEKLINKNTKAIFFETITNPQLEVVDIKILSSIARKYSILLISDTTLTPIYFFNSKDLGIDIEVISSTKYISGGATSVGGIIIDNGIYDWSKIAKLENDAKKFGPFAFITKLKREVYRNLGSCLSPHNAYLQSIGLETLALRADKSCSNALTIAKSLGKSKRVVKVNYPGLESSPYHLISDKQFSGKFGALLTFELESREKCFSFLNKLKLVRRATNIQDNKTLALHPASTIFCEYSPQLKLEMGVPDTLIRIAVGIEDVEDIIDDIKQALEE
ncbi:MAG: aminotransferase class I/II-fold pyridoxal phosphate-dependent enzyme [Elusimicrobia bacterium]|nr:aminotransferase class I/II-fold pyridoxal phosphate-dependent enzyme [Elusimicrobiota bacterium]